MGSMTGRQEKAEAKWSLQVDRLSSLFQKKWKCTVRLRAGHNTGLWIGPRQKQDPSLFG